MAAGRRALRAPAVAALGAVASLWCGGVAGAHEGPPFPILVDREIPGHLVSVWADPDVGTGEIHVILEPTDSAPPLPTPAVDVRVQPVSGRLAAVTYPAARQVLPRRVQFLAEPAFDRQEMWSIGVVVRRADGQASEVVTEVEVTPPGYGRWDLLVNLVPFLVFGGIWGIALLRRWRARTAAAHAGPPARLEQVAK
jgi:hypothetical protein